MKLLLDEPVLKPFEKYTGFCKVQIFHDAKAETLDQFNKALDYIGFKNEKTSSIKGYAAYKVKYVGQAENIKRRAIQFARAKYGMGQTF